MTKLIAAALSCLITLPAGAMEWQALGARGVGMGGAGVALPQAALSSYWNPAALGAATPSGVEIPLEAHEALTGDVVEGANELRDIGNNPAAHTAAEANAALAKFNEPGNGLRVDAGGGADAKFGRLAVFLNGFGAYGAVPRADLTTTAPATLTATNNSKLTIKGVNLGELGVGYGHELPFAPGLFAGGNFKVLSGQVGYADFFVLREEVNGSAMAKRLKDGAVKSGNVGIDAGLLWDVARSFEGVPLRPRLGLTGRNINNPKFTQPDAAKAAGLSDKFAVNPQYRMGAALTPLPWWNVAVDLDLSRNLTALDNAASRQFSLGTEFNVINRPTLNVPIRAGLQKNLADKGAKTQLSLGSGLDFMHVSLEASALWSPKRVNTKTSGDANQIPAELSLGLTLGVLFGGADDETARSHRGRSAYEDAQPAPTQRVRESAEKAQKQLDAEPVKQP